MGTTTDEFDDQVAVTPEASGTYAAELPAGWRVGGGINGGYLLGVLGSALRVALPDKPHPLALSAHYVAASTPGPATVSVEVRRDGGSVATAAVDLVQDGALRITALATCGDLDRFAARGGIERSFATEPVLPPVEECPSSLDAPAAMKEFVPMLDRFDLRLDPAHAGWREDFEPGMAASIGGWFRFADGREPDALSLLTVCDVLPPTTFDLGHQGWAPTLELTVHVRAHPAPGWLKVRHATRVLAGGMFEEDAEVWDSSGRLVAQSRQLALQPR